MNNRPNEFLIEIRSGSLRILINTSPSLIGKLGTLVASDQPTTFELTLEEVKMAPEIQEINDLIPTSPPAERLLPSPFGWEPLNVSRSEASLYAYYRNELGLNGTIAGHLAQRKIDPLRVHGMTVEELMRVGFDRASAEQIVAKSLQIEPEHVPEELGDR